MSGLVIELQKEITSSNCDVVCILRKAHIIASKLKLEEFDLWVTNELNGYKSLDQIPEYRIVKGKQLM